MQIMTIQELERWAMSSAKVGDYLALYEDCDEDCRREGDSRCGYSDNHLDVVKRILGSRKLMLGTNDRGLVVRRIVLIPW